MSIDYSWLGRWTSVVEFEVTAEHIRAYAAATNDENPRHVAGELAPPVFAVVPGMDLIPRVMDSLVAEEYRRFGVHGEQDMFFHRGIVPGMVLRSRAACKGIQPTRTGVSVVVKSETHDAAGELVNGQYITMFIRGLTDARAAGEPSPDHRMPDGLRGVPPMASVSDVIAPDQTYRYAEASGDHSRIHLDDGYARSVGLPGIIVHGMCTMAFASRAVVGTACGDDSTRLRRLAVRFARPVLPGQQITTQVWRAGERDAGDAYAFAVVNATGKAVIQDGLAEVAR